jgi:hypothetical protein
VYLASSPPLVNVVTIDLLVIGRLEQSVNRNKVKADGMLLHRSSIHYVVSQESDNAHTVLSD